MTDSSFLTEPEVTFSDPTERKTIFFLTPWYPTKGHRYAGVFVREYAKALRPHCKVVVLHCGLTDPALARPWTTTQEVDQSLTAGIPSFRVSFRPSPFPGLSFIRNVRSVHHAITSLSKVYGRPSLIHGHVFLTGWSALLAAKSRRIPIVMSEHWTAFSRGILFRFEIWQARAIYRLVDKVLPVSRALQRSLEAYGVKAVFQVVPNVVDTSLFKWNKLTTRTPGVLRLLVVSSLAEHKGLEFLFRALKDVDWRGRGWHLDIVGDGPDAAKLRAAVRETGLEPEVTFHGPLEREEVAHMMRKTDLFVLPSLFETFSVAAAEALVSGVPVVVTRCGGPEEFVSEKAGTIVPPGNAMALAQGITATLDRLSTFERGVIAREAEEMFGPDRVSTILYDLYTGLIKDHLHPARQR